MYKVVFLVFLLSPAGLFLAQNSEVQNSEDWRGLLKLARESYQKKEYQRALLFYQTALPVVPKEIDLSEELAQTQYRLQQYDASSSIYSKKVDGEKKTKSRAYHNLGNIAMEKKDYVSAIESYKNALRNDPKDVKTRYNLSEAIRRKKEAEENTPPPPPEDKEKESPKKDKKDQNKEKKEPKKSNGQKNPSALSDNSVERELDRLMKKEAQTKRKIADQKDGQAGQSSTKEW